jgi:hypothetical protein
MRIALGRTALAALAAVSLRAAARAQGGLEGTLRRAREGEPLRRADRQFAADLLREWRASEEVAPGTGDPSLGRALEAMAAGRALSSRDVAALRRHGEACRRSRVGEVETFPGPRRPAPGPGPGVAAGGGGPSRRDIARYWPVAAAGLVVVVLGAAWIVLARGLRGRRR